MSEKMTMKFLCPAAGGYVQLVQPEGGGGWWWWTLEAGPGLSQPVSVDVDEEYVDKESDLPSLDAESVFTGRYRLQATQIGKFNVSVSAYSLTYAELESFFRNVKRWFD